MLPLPEFRKDIIVNGSGPVEWVEELKKGIVIKKILEVENPIRRFCQSCHQSDGGEG